MTQNRKRYAVIVADDFGSSSSVNEAVAQAHDRGVVSAVSIMSGGEAFEEAVQLARMRNSLSVGLHVTLCDGRSVLQHADVPGLVDEHGRFEGNPTRAWIRYNRPDLMRQIDGEINAQFAQLEQAGIQPDHVDGHHHLHMHPALFSMICRHASRRGVRWIRIPYEPLSLVLSTRNTARGIMPFLEWAVFGMLRLFYRARARTFGMQAIPHVFGLSRTGLMDERYMVDTFARAGELFEIFSHPDLATEKGRREFETLTSKEVRARMAELGIGLTGFQELSMGP